MGDYEKFRSLVKTLCNNDKFGNAACLHAGCQSFLKNADTRTAHCSCSGLAVALYKR